MIYLEIEFMSKTVETFRQLPVVYISRTINNFFVNLWQNFLTERKLFIISWQGSVGIG